MDAKNSELADRDRAIFYFIIACIAFLILLFYILRSNLLRRQTNRQLQSQKTQIEMQKQEITDSINYAKRIQGAILPPADLIRSVFPESFVLFKPKDIVSGDFYWLQETEKGCFIAAADCTGHGVPGAFMSMIASDKLSESGLFTSDAAQLLKLVNQGIKKALRQSEKEDSTRDGMDIALCFFDKEKKHVEYAGANRPLWVRKNNSAEMTELKATKVAIGGLTENDAEFTKHQVELGKGDLIYLFSDGYADQFSPGDKKLMSRKFKEVLLGMGDKTMMEQKELLEKYFDSWKGNMEQTDDVLVIGIRV
jgi:serine phosphatase RsbU (regulator of sigma subunit)